MQNLLEIRRLQLRQRQTELELERRVAMRTAELEEARLEVLERLATAGEFRDDETGEHARRVGATAQLLADRTSGDARTAASGSPPRCTTSARSRSPTPCC